MRLQWLQWLPGILGALLVVAGVAVVWWPAGLVVAGGFLLVLDNKLTAGPPARRVRRPPGDEVR